jgi:hypothetical protein
MRANTLKEQEQIKWSEFKSTFGMNKNINSLNKFMEGQNKNVIWSDFL